MSNRDLQMIFRLSALPVLILVLGCLNGKAQYYPRIDTLEVLPASPTIKDSINIWTELTIPDVGRKIRDSIWTSKDTFHIFSCMHSGFQSSFYTFSDTFAVGQLTVGTYYVSLKAYYTIPPGNICIPDDSTSRIISFQVIDDIGLREMKFGDGIRLQLYPNPSSALQQINLYTQIPVPLQINLHDIAGQKVMQILSGQSVQGQQEFDADLSQLPTGVYFYRVKVGEETRHLKAIKQ